MRFNTGIGYKAKILIIGGQEGICSNHSPSRRTHGRQLITVFPTSKSGKNTLVFTILLNINTILMCCRNLFLKEEI